MRSHQKQCVNFASWPLTDLVRSCTKAWRGSSPNFQLLSLDPTHLAMVYEYATLRKKTPGSHLLRAIMKRFTVPFTEASPMPAFCEYMFDGSGAPSSSVSEKRFQRYIEALNMPAGMAKRVARKQGDAGPFQRREEFAQALAALCALYPHEVKLVSPGPNRKIHQLLRSATEPDRVEFYFNNLRQRWLWRSKDLTMLPSGTTSNEAIRVCKLHPTPKLHSTQSLYRSFLPCPGYVSFDISPYSSWLHPSIFRGAYTDI